MAWLLVLGLAGKLCNLWVHLTFSFYAFEYFAIFSIQVIAHYNVLNSLEYHHHTRGLYAGTESPQHVMIREPGS